MVGSIAFHKPIGVDILPFSRFASMNEQASLPICFQNFGNLVVCRGKCFSRLRPVGCLNSASKSQDARKTLINRLSRLAILIFSVTFGLVYSPDRSVASTSQVTISTRDISSQRSVALIARAAVIESKPAITDQSPLNPTATEDLKSTASGFLQTNLGKASVAVAFLLTIWRVIAAIRSELKLRFLLAEFLSSDFFKIFDFWKVRVPCNRDVLNGSFNLAAATSVHIRSLISRAHVIWHLAHSS
jgi:hypothetical protein